MSEKKDDGYGKFEGAEFPKDAFGRTYHLTTKDGEIANRLIFVGSLFRAETVAKACLKKLKHFEKGYFDHTSDRYVRTITGIFVTSEGKEVPVTICGTGMGYPMNDFAIRENRAMIKGDMAVIRVGTCGLLKSEKDGKKITLGDVVIADECVLILRNPDAFRKDASDEEKKKPYQWSKPVPGTKELTDLFYKNVCKKLGEEKTHRGMNGSACSFYSSQGRVLKDFNDRNEDLKEIFNTTPELKNLTTLEMETFHIYDLADCARENFYCSGAAITLAGRKTDEFLDAKIKKNHEEILGMAALETICCFPLKNELSMEDGVWNAKFWEKRGEEYMKNAPKMEKITTD